MKKMICAGLVSGFLVINLGCAANSIIASDAQKMGVYSGNVGITGNDTHLTIQRGSVVPKLSIIGDRCVVVVEDGTEVGRIEFWGNGSSVSVPADAVVWVSQVGTNSFVRRPREKTPSTRPHLAP